MEHLPVEIWQIAIGLSVLCIIAFAAFRSLRVKFSRFGLAALLLILLAVIWVETTRISDLERNQISFAATLRSAADTPLRAHSAQIGSSDFVDLIDLQNDVANLAFWEQCARFFVLQTPADDQPPGAAIRPNLAAAAVRSSMLCGKFSGMLIIDAKGRYIGAFDRSLFLESVPIVAGWKNAADMSIVQSAETAFGDLLSQPEKSIKQGLGFDLAINQDQTLADAFNAFRSHDIRFMPITDEPGRLVGAISRRTVTENLLAGLLTNPK